MGEAIPTLLIVSVLIFFLLRLAPGGPFDSERAWPPEIQKNIEARYGLDQPIVYQFFSWMGDAIQGDLKESFQYIGKPVTSIIAETLPISLVLGVWALLAAILIGIPLGTLAAWKRGTWIDVSSVFISISGVSLPSYLVASVLILGLSLHFQWFPPALWEGPESAILPILTLMVKPAAVIARLTRTSLIDAMNADYIRTARAKGLTENRVVFKHALKNSLIPVLAILGPITANLVTGSFVVEFIFQIPGMGKHFVSAVLNRDYPLVMGVSLIYGMILVFSNLLSDLALAWADPRGRKVA